MPAMRAHPMVVHPPVPAHPPQRSGLGARAIEVEPHQPPADLPPMRVLEPLCAVFRRQLKSEGLKYTPERAQVLAAVVETDGAPFAAARVLEAVRGAGFAVSKATLYRTLRLLAEARIIERVLAQGDEPCYRLAYGAEGCVVVRRSDSGEMLPVSEDPRVRDVVAQIEGQCRAMCAALGLESESIRLEVVARARQGG